MEHLSTSIKGLLKKHGYAILREDYEGLGVYFRCNIALANDDMTVVMVTNLFRDIRDKNFHFYKVKNEPFMGKIAHIRLNEELLIIKNKKPKYWRKYMRKGIDKWINK